MKWKRHIRNEAKPPINVREVRSEMKLLHRLSLLIVALPSVLPLRAEDPIIPPSLAKVWPVGMERGDTASSASRAATFRAPKP